MTDVEGSAVRPRGPVLPSEDEARVELRCAACGYGATVRMGASRLPDVSRQRLGARLRPIPRRA
jgi:hypothetical protein